MYFLECQNYTCFSIMFLTREFLMENLCLICQDQRSNWYTIQKIYVHVSFVILYDISWVGNYSITFLNTVTLVLFQGHILYQICIYQFLNGEFVILYQLRRAWVSMDFPVREKYMIIETINTCSS